VSAGRAPLRAVLGLAAICAVFGVLSIAPVSAARADEPAASGGEAAQATGQPQGEPSGEHEAPHLDGGKLALQFFNFAVLAFILAWFGGKALNKSLLARHEQLKADLASASAARAAAEGRAAEQEKRLASLETEIESIRTGIKAEAEAEKQRLIALAEERARGIGEETKFLLDQQVKQAEATLRIEVVEAAVKIAEQLVTRSLDARDQRRLLDTFVADVAGDAPASAPAAPASAPAAPAASGGAA